MPVSRAAESKGVNFKGVLDAVAALYGPDSERAVVEACPPALRSVLTHHGLMPGGWYSVEWYRELHGAAQRTLKRGPELARECSNWTIKRDLSGIYKALLFLLTPQSMLAKGPRILQQYWRGGVMRIPEARQGMASVAFEGWLGFNRNVWLDMLGGTEGALEAAGAKNVRTRVVSGGYDDDESFELELRWTTR